MCSLTMRRRSSEKRKVSVDSKYNNELVAKFINMIMGDGKKSLAQRIVYDSFNIIKEKTGKPEMKVFTTAINNVRPKVEVRPRRVGGATYQIPVEVNKIRGTTLALRWIRDSARSKTGKSMSSKLAEEILAAHRQEGDAVKKKQNTHKMAAANKAFAHYRW